MEYDSDWRIRVGMKTSADGVLENKWVNQEA
jgi:hypothetical protein